MALPVNSSTHLIPAYYSFIDPERMKGWVGLVGWPVADGLPTLMVTHQLQVERRTGQVCQSETDVLPLCHATNRLAVINCILLLFITSFSFCIISPCLCALSIKICCATVGISIWESNAVRSLHVCEFCMRLQRLIHRESKFSYIFIFIHRNR